MLDRNDKYYLTPAERLVMRVIWMSDHGPVLGEILNGCNMQYQKNWKPQTVSTYLSHLVQKKYLKMERNGKYCQYYPLINEEQYLSYDINNFAEYWRLDPEKLKKDVEEMRR